MKKDTLLRDLVLGLVCFFGGVYIIFQNTAVTASWGFYLGRYHISSGLIILPLLIGVVWKVINPSSKIAWGVMGLGILCILLTIIMGVRIHFLTTSLFDYVLMFGLTAVGFGLLLKSYWTSNHSD